MLLNSLADKVILVTDGINDSLSIKNAKREIQPAFIPPQSSSSKVPGRIINFVNEARLTGKNIVVSNAFRIARHNDQDLYGLDLCIEAFSNTKIRSQASLIFVISDPQYNHVEVEEALANVGVKGLGSSVLIYCGSLDYFALLQHADASIRATNTDGDALSVRESIYLGVPCIASDCVNRPSEAILFKSRSATSLVESILKVISTERQQAKPDACDYSEFYKQIYLGY
jgi:glycosyltransferase involved in cell wall biosynthesis